MGISIGTGGILEGLRTAVMQRGEDLVARASVKALDALEVVEKLEGKLAAAPEKLREFRIRASDALLILSGADLESEENLAQARAAQAPQPQAPKMSVSKQAQKVEGRIEVLGVDVQVEARPARKAPLPPPPPQIQGRKAAPVNASAKSAKAKQPRRKKGFVVKRGQKHHNH